MVTWTLILIIITMPLTSMDRFQRRDIRRYDRAIRKLEKRKNLNLRKNETVPEKLLYYANSICKSQ